MWWIAVLAGGHGTPDEQGKPEPLDPPSGCDPLVPDVCALPWPSSLFEVDDPTTATGHRVAIGDHTLPTNSAGLPFQPAMFDRLDGFSTAGPLLVYFDDA